MVVHTRLHDWIVVARSLIFSLAALALMTAAAATLLRALQPTPNTTQHDKTLLHTQNTDNTANKQQASIKPTTVAP